MTTIELESNTRLDISRTVPKVNLENRIFALYDRLGLGKNNELLDPIKRSTKNKNVFNSELEESAWVYGMVSTLKKKGSNDRLLRAVASLGPTERLSSVTLLWDAGWNGSERTLAIPVLIRGITANIAKISREQAELFLASTWDIIDSRFMEGDPIAKNLRNESKVPRTIPETLSDLTTSIQVAEHPVLDADLNGLGVTFESLTQRSK